ncbi:site-specific integrase [Oxalobacteraceae bacterium OM1]|nr:site-specific integrase [Oxalobacteraceae bacterium OM1]
MNETARKVVLPKCVLTRVADPCSSTAHPVCIAERACYWTQSVIHPDKRARIDGRAIWSSSTLRMFPVVLQPQGTPWDEANLWLFDMAESRPVPNMVTLSSIADDLAAYCRFIVLESIDWLDFPAHKLFRPTYRYLGFLKQQVAGAHISPGTAKRRMNVVVRFYRWLIQCDLFVPANKPWKEGETLVFATRDYGQPIAHRVKTTDLRISVPPQDDPYDGYIQDGGKLRPLTFEEQGWLIGALDVLGNTEMTLIHLFSLLTGARIQTVLTTRVKSVVASNCGTGSHVALGAGPQYGTDTKYNKKLMLYLPRWFYETLQTYAQSQRAQVRRRRVAGGDTESQYLFLSVRGLPMYAAKNDVEFSETQNRHHTKCGQAVRQYMRDYIIPYVQQKHNASFRYRFHDLRATYGMNLVDALSPLVDKGEITYTRMLDIVRARMGHASIKTTECYLQFRQRQRLVREACDNWEEKLQELARKSNGT